MDKFEDLIDQRKKIEERIKKLEIELKKPMTQDLVEAVVDKESYE